MLNGFGKSLVKHPIRLHHGKPSGWLVTCLSSCPSSVQKFYWSSLKSGGGGLVPRLGTYPTSIPRLEHQDGQSFSFKAPNTVMLLWLIRFHLRKTHFGFQETSHMKELGCVCFISYMFAETNWIYWRNSGVFELRSGEDHNQEPWIVIETANNFVETHSVFSCLFNTRSLNQWKQWESRRAHCASEQNNSRWSSLQDGKKCAEGPCWVLVSTLPYIVTSKDLAPNVVIHQKKHSRSAPN